MPWLFSVIALGAVAALVGVGLVASPATPADPRWLGVQVEPMTADAAQALGLPASQQGVLVADVSGAGAQAGVKEGDVVVAVNGAPAADIPSYRAALEAASTSGPAELTVVRDGKTRAIRVSTDSLGGGAAQQAAARTVAWMPRCYRRLPCPQGGEGGRHAGQRGGWQTGSASPGVMVRGTGLGGGGAIPAALPPQCQTCPTAPSCAGAGAGSTTQVAWPRRSTGGCPLGAPAGGSRQVALPALPAAAAPGASTNPCATCPVR
jgi:membrane-associated protease RseP (regulator of RpoE activity)